MRDFGNEFRCKIEANEFGGGGASGSLMTQRRVIYGAVVEK